MYPKGEFGPYGYDPEKGRVSCFLLRKYVKCRNENPR